MPSCHQNNIRFCRLKIGLKHHQSGLSSWFLMLEWQKMCWDESVSPQPKSLWNWINIESVGTTIGGRTPNVELQQQCTLAAVIQKQLLNTQSSRNRLAKVFLKRSLVNLLWPQRQTNITIPWCPAALFCFSLANFSDRHPAYHTAHAQQCKSSCTTT